MNEARHRPRCTVAGGQGGGRRFQAHYRADGAAAVPLLPGRASRTSTTAPPSSSRSRRAATTKPVPPQTSHQATTASSRATLRGLRGSCRSPVSETQPGETPMRRCAASAAPLHGEAAARDRGPPEGPLVANVRRQRPRVIDGGSGLGAGADDGAIVAAGVPGHRTELACRGNWLAAHEAAECHASISSRSPCRAALQGTSRAAKAPFRGSPKSRALGRIK